MMEQDGNAASKGDGNAVPGVGRGSEPGESPASQFGVRSTVAEGEMGGFDQECTEIAVPFLGDGEVGVAVAGLVKARGEAKVGTNLTASAEARVVSKGEDKGEGGNRPHTGYLLEVTSLRKLFVDNPLQETVQLGNARGEVGDLSSEWDQGGLEGEWHPGGSMTVKVAGVAGG
jgi:hypothetical protein